MDITDRSSNSNLLFIPDDSGKYSHTRTGSDERNDERNEIYLSCNDSVDSKILSVRTVDLLVYKPGNTDPDQSETQCYQEEHKRRQRQKQQKEKKQKQMSCFIGGIKNMDFSENYVIGAKQVAVILAEDFAND